MRTVLLGVEVKSTTMTRLEVSGVITRFLYTPFGRQSARLTGVGYEGQYLESNELYLVANGLRAYLPSLMCFAQADSYSPFQRATENSYAFNLGDPVNRIDPTGHASLPAMISLIIKAKRWANKVKPVTTGKRYLHFVEDAQMLFLNRLPNRAQIKALDNRYLFPSDFLKKRLSFVEDKLEVRKNLFRQTAKLNRADIFERVYPSLDRQPDAERAVLQKILSYRENNNVSVGNWMS